MSSTVAETAVLSVDHYINGTPVPAIGSSRWSVDNPASGEEICSVVLDDVAAVDNAVQAAADAFPSWSALSLSKRTAILVKFRELVVAHTDELASIVSREQGKMHDDARGEVQRGLEVLDLAISAPVLLRGEHSDQIAGSVDVHSFRQALGVCVGVTPFNFPVMIPLWMFPIALAAGNTFVLKPSEQDPGAAMLLAQLSEKAGFPPGVLNVVHGGKPVVDALLDNTDVAAVSFVGSTPVARHVYQRATRNNKRAQAFGGAKNHAVIMPDADLDAAADALTSAAYGSAGQRCMAISVAVTVGDIADELVSKISERIGKLVVAPATDNAADMGPLISSRAKARTLDYLTTAHAEGASIVVDGRSLDIADDESGNFVGPTLVDHTGPGMRIYDDEVFGPVLSITRTQSLAEALDLVNDNPYGNGAAIFTANGFTAREFSRKVTAGMVGINVPIPVPAAAFGFGGWKNSIFGDHHMYGSEAFRFYTRHKVVTSRWPAPHDVSTTNLSFPTQ